MIGPIFSKKKRKRDMLKNSYSFSFSFLLWKHQLKNIYWVFSRLGFLICNKATVPIIISSLSLQWADGWPQQTTRAASVKKLKHWSLRTRRKTHSSLSLMVEQKRVEWLNLQRTSTKTPTRAWMGHWCQHWTIEDGSSILMNLMLDCCDECAWIYALHIWWICDCVGEEGLREIFEIKIHCETKFALLVLSP